MRILIVGLNFHPEFISTGKYTTELAQFLKDSGDDVFVVTAPPYYPEWRVQDPYRWWGYRRETLGGIRIQRCPLWVPRRVTGGTRLVHLASFALSSMPVILRQAAWQPDWVLAIAPTILTAPVALAAARLCGGRAWLHVQDFELDAAFGLRMLGGQKLYGAARWVETRLMRRFDCVSTISERMLEGICERGIAPEGSYVVPNWVDTSAIYPLDGANPLRGELGLAPSDLVVLYAGNMGRKQGLDLLLDAARLLGGQRTIQFVLCGNGMERDRLKRLAVRLANVRFVDLQPPERLNALLNLADIHVLPQVVGVADSVMPSKLAGMLASARPVVATAAHGTELANVVRGVGVVVEPGKARALADAIARLGGDRTLRRRLGSAARRYAVDHLSRDHVLGRFAEQLHMGMSSQDRDSG